MDRIEFGDFLVIAEAVTGVDANALARQPRVAVEAQGALAAPWAGFGEVELFPALATKAAIYASRILRHHPLIDGNERVAWLVMREFVARNGEIWIGKGADAQAAVIEQVAAGLIAEPEFIVWVAERIK